MKARSSKAKDSGGTPVRAPRRRVAVGPPRPQYLLSAENDRMMAIITALMAEVSALRDRLDTHEALAEKRCFATTPAVERYRLSKGRHEARERARQEMLGRVYRILLEDLESARQNEHPAAGSILTEELSAT